MISHVYKPKRKNEAGKSISARLYRGRYRLDGEFVTTDIALGTGDKQVAEKKLAGVIKERERERAGIIAPKLQRNSANVPLAQHLEEFLTDLLAKGRNKSYVSILRSRTTKLFEQCDWKRPVDVSSDGFVHWRSKQEAFAPKTLNEYLNGVCALLNWMERHGRIASNPLGRMDRVDMRGKQRKRRSYSDDELSRL